MFRPLDGNSGCEALAAWTQIMSGFCASDVLLRAEKLKLIGKKRVRRSFTGGWLRVNVHPRMTSCPRGHRRRAGLQADQRLTLLLRVSDLDQSTVHQLVNTPVDCGSTSTLDTADRLGTLTRTLVLAAVSHHTRHHLPASM